MNRRKFLALAGGGVILAAGGTLGVVASRFPQKALEPWENAGSLYTEPRKKALSYAILAPNPHNMQPWLVDLSVAKQVTLTVDRNKLLPHTDPFNRQITIGLGCFLEVLSLAAASDGYRVQMELFPQGSDEKSLDRRPVAVASFVKDPTIKPDSLFNQVLTRRSLKDPYDTDRPVSTEVLTNLQSTSTNGSKTFFNNEQSHVEKLRRLTHEALDIELDTPRTHKESVNLFRIGKAEVEANPDGIDLAGPMMETLYFAGAISRKQMLDPTSTGFAEGKKLVAAQTQTAMAHLWLTTPGNSRIDQINAGRDWVRVNLAATAHGVGIHPLSQALQEYPEMTNHFKMVHKMLAPEGGTIQMLARLGYTTAAPPSPRWPLEAKILKG